MQNGITTHLLTLMAPLPCRHTSHHGVRLLPNESNAETYEPFMPLSHALRYVVDALSQMLRLSRNTPVGRYAFERC